MKKKFPHFTRFFPETLPAPLGRLILWTLLAVLFIINIVTGSRLPRTLGAQRLHTLLDYGVVQAHIDLARAFWQEGRQGMAKNEMLLAQSLTKSRTKPDEVHQTQVLGMASPPLELLRLWEEEPTRVSDAYAFWKQVAVEKPDYRDAYILLGVLAYQRSDAGSAQSYLQYAKALDPNSPVVDDVLSTLHF